MWGTAKAILKESTKYILYKRGKVSVNNLSSYPKNVEKEEQNKPKERNNKERIEINGIENRKQ